MNDNGAGSHFLRLKLVCLHPEMSVFVYPKIPQPNAAVHTMEKATTITSHMSSLFILNLP